MTDHPHPLDAYRARMAEAVERSNVPTLLMVLVQLTGALRWLEKDVQPTRGKGLSDNDSGGLPPQTQRRIRNAALDAICAWHAGEPVAIPDPDEALLVRMLSVAVGEPVPEEYGPMIADDLRSVVTETSPIPVEHTAPTGTRAVVIGAGISGMLAAHHLRQVGVDVTIVEKQERPGGCWYENRYPGCGVDVPSHLYQFSFVPSDWEHFYASRDELYAYLDQVTDLWGLRELTRYKTAVTRATWDDSQQHWLMDVEGPDRSTETLVCNFVISAVGAFGSPKIPEIVGMDDFEGEIHHTARWPHSATVDDRRIGVIGSGASAMQVVPAVAGSAESLTVFQRTPHWVAPFEKLHRPIPDDLRLLLREVPLYRAWYRQRLSWLLNDKLYESFQRDPSWPHPERSINAINDGHRRLFTEYIESELDGRPDLVEQVVPDFPPFGKRILLDNGWYRTLRRPNVQLETSPIERFTSTGILLASGEERRLDLVVMATGFDVVSFLSSIDVVGRHGQRLHDVWKGDDAQAYLGTSIPGFPNFFCLYGPNTQAGHGGSLVFYLEAQMRYVMSVLNQVFAEGIGAVEVSQSIHDAYNEDVVAAHERMIWTHPGVATYYRNSRGRVVVSNPWRVVDFWHMTRDANLAEYLRKPIRN